MIPEHFYTLISVEEISASQHFLFNVVINHAHVIFEGHFHQQPIVPGVLMIAMVKDLIEHQLKTTIQLTNACNIKYLNILIPTKNQQIEIDLLIGIPSINTITCSGSIKQAEIVFCKYRLQFTDVIKIV